MTIEAWFPAILGYLMPVGLFLLAWGGMRPSQARRSTTRGALALALGGLGYFSVGFAFHLGGAGLMSDHAGLASLSRLFAGEAGSQWGIVGLSGFLLAGAEATPEIYTLFLIYLPMVVSVVLLAVLSLSDRARGWQMLLGGLLLAGGLFPVVACWAWGGGWLANLGSTLERGHGFVDHSGSGVVYLLGGFAALGALAGLGRSPSTRPTGEAQADGAVEMPPAHFPLLANLGALLFGLGWLAWSLSTPFHVVDADLNIPRIAVNGLMAATGAVITSQSYCWLTTGGADPLMSARGATAGFIAISAGSPFVPPWASLVIGAVTGLLLPFGVFVVEHLLRLADTTGTIALGTTAGAWGLVAVALFADGRSGQGWNGVGATEYHTVLGQGVTGFLPAPGFVGDGPGQLIAQLVGLGAIAVPVVLVYWLMFFALSLPSRRLGRRDREARTGWLASVGRQLTSRQEAEADVDRA